MVSNEKITKKAADIKTTATDKFVRKHIIQTVSPTILGKTTRNASRNVVIQINSLLAQQKEVLPNHVFKTGE